MCQFEDKLSVPARRVARSGSSDPGIAAGTCARSGSPGNRSGHLVVGGRVLPTAGRAAQRVVQALLQFICGYHDADLRDSTGLGHGRLIAAHAPPQLRDRWVPRLLAGAVPGIAVTEPHGGSQVHATATQATPPRDGTWQVTGMKTWISRLAEAAVFCTVLHRAGRGDRRAAAVDADATGFPAAL